MRKRNLISAVLVVLMCVAVLAGCNRFRGKAPTLGDIFVDRASASEITGYDTELILPEGWEVLSSATGDHKDSDIGYIRSLDAFVVVKVLSYDDKGNAKEYGSLSVARATGGAVAESDLLIPASAGVQAIHVEGGLIAVRTNSDGGGGRIGQAGVLDGNGKVVIDPHYTEGVGSANINDAIRILDDELVAVNPVYDKNTTDKNYTPIYRVSTGELACRVYNPSRSLTGVLGFDGKYVSVETSDGSGTKKKVESMIYQVPERASETPDTKARPNGAFTRFDDGLKNFYTEATYLGGGKFYVHEEYAVSSSDDYTYKYDNTYYKASRWFYYPDTDTLEPYVSQFIMLNTVNTYYDYATDRYDVVPTSYLRDGYSYSSFGLYIPESKEAEYDQFIVDGDMNVVLSLTGNFGIRVNGVDRDEVSYYDLMLQFTDGYGYAPLAPSRLKVYDRDGNTVFENKDYDFVSVNIHDGVVIAGIENKDGDTVFGAFDLDGDLIIDFKYRSIEPFRGYYTYAVNDETGNAVLLARDGTEVGKLKDGSAPFSDMAKTSNKKPIYKRGCYVYETTEKVGDKSVKYFGVKNFNADTSKNTVLPATLTSCTIYSPNVDNNLVFVFGKHEKGGAQYVYRLV